MKQKKVSQAKFLRLGDFFNLLYHLQFIYPYPQEVFLKSYAHLRFHSSVRFLRISILFRRWLIQLSEYPKRLYSHSAVNRQFRILQFINPFTGNLCHPQFKGFSLFQYLRGSTLSVNTPITGTIIDYHHNKNQEEKILLQYKLYLYSHLDR